MDIRLKGEFVMRLFVKWTCLLLVIVLVAISFVGCGKKEASSASDGNYATTDAENAEKAASLIGTWQGSDHDGENIVRYLIIDEKGYWNICMNYATLEKAIKQMPDRYKSFPVTFTIDEPRNNSDHTGCFYEYVEGDSYVDQFSIDEDGNLTAKFASDVTFSQCTKSFEEVNDEAKDVFLTAQGVVLGELNK